MASCDFIHDGRIASSNEDDRVLYFECLSYKSNILNSTAAQFTAEHDDQTVDARNLNNLVLVNIDETPQTCCGAATDDEHYEMVIATRGHVSKTSVSLCITRLVFFAEVFIWSYRHLPTHQLVFLSLWQCLIERSQRCFWVADVSVWISCCYFSKYASCDALKVTRRRVSPYDGNGSVLSQRHNSE